jgi:hypothetical protein
MIMTFFSQKYFDAWCLAKEKFIAILKFCLIFDSVKNHLVAEAKC